MNRVLSSDESYWSEKNSQNFLIWISFSDDYSVYVKKPWNLKMTLLIKLLVVVQKNLTQKRLTWKKSQHEILLLTVSWVTIWEFFGRIPEPNSLSFGLNCCSGIYNCLPILVICHGDISIFIIFIISTIFHQTILSIFSITVRFF